MDKAEVMKLIDNYEYLAHYGIKGQSWGVRRFQNEDGSLTPEGRKRYGLKDDYSKMSDKELQDAINRKRLENQYVSLKTEKTAKKQRHISEFVRTASNTASTTVNLVDKTVGVKDRDEMDESLKKLRKEKEANENLLNKNRNKPNVDTSAVEKKIDDLKAEIEKQENGIKASNTVTQLTNQVVNEPGKHADKIGKMAEGSKLKKETQEAYEEIKEMDKKTLEDTVKRMLLEKQYEELTNPPKKDNWEKGKEVVQTIGSILGIALTGAMLIEKLKILEKLFHSGMNYDGKEREVNGMDYHFYLNDNDYLAHYGIEGMKKGVRRFQNEDGSLTPEGYRRYGIDPNTGRGNEVVTTRQMNRYEKDLHKTEKAEAKARGYDRRSNPEVNKNMRNIYGTERMQQRERHKKNVSYAGMQGGLATGAMTGSLTGNKTNLGSNLGSLVGATSGAATGYAAGALIGNITGKYKNKHYSTMEKFDNFMNKDIEKMSEGDQYKEFDNFKEDIANDIAERLAPMYGENGKVNPKSKEAKEMYKEIESVLRAVADEFGYDASNAVYASIAYAVSKKRERENKK